jgi:hypothetical protein
MGRYARTVEEEAAEDATRQQRFEESQAKQFEVKASWSAQNAVAKMIMRLSPPRS